MKKFIHKIQYNTFFIIPLNFLYRLSPEQWKELLKQIEITKTKTIGYLHDSGREEWAKDRSLFTKYVQ